MVVVTNSSKKRKLLGLPEAKNPFKFDLPTKDGGTIPGNPDGAGTPNPKRTGGSRSISRSNNVPMTPVNNDAITNRIQQEERNRQAVEQQQRQQQQLNVIAQIRKQQEERRNQLLRPPSKYGGDQNRLTPEQIQQQQRQIQQSKPNVVQIGQEQFVTNVDAGILPYSGILDQTNINRSTYPSGTMSNYGVAIGDDNRTTVIENVINKYRQAEDIASSKTTKPFYNYLAEKGLNLTDVKFQKLFVPSLIGVGSFGVQYPEEVKDVYAGASAGFNEDIKENPLKQLGIVGTGAASSLLLEGAGAGFSSISKGAGTTFNYVKTVGGVGATGLYGYQTYQDIKDAPDYASIGKTLGVGGKDLALFAGGYKIGSQAYVKNFITEKTTPEINFGTDQIQPIVTKNGQFELAKYKLRIKTPEIKVYSDTPIKRFLRNDFGVSEKYAGLKLEKTVPSKTIIQVGDLISQQGRILYGQTSTGKPDKTLRYLGFLTGSQKEFSVNELYNSKYSSLSKLDKNMLADLTGGLAKIKDVNYFKGDLTTKKLFRTSGIDTRTGNVKLGKEINIRFPKQGKTINRYSTISTVEEIGTVEGQFSAYRTQLALKDITKPNFKDTGKYDKVFGFSKVKEPKYLDYGVDDFKVKLLKPSDLISLDKTAIAKSSAAVTSTKTSSVKDIFSLNSKSVSSIVSKSKTNALNEINRINALPISVGGLGKQESKYFGNPSYSGFDSSGLLSVDKVFGSNKMDSSSGSITKNLNPSINIYKSVGGSSNKELNKEINKNLNKEVNKTINKEISRELTKQSQKEMLKSALKLNLKTNQKFSNPYYYAPKINYPKETLLFNSLIKSNPSIRIDYSQFNVFLRRYGKFKPIGTTSDLNRAFSLGTSATKNTLGATFAVKGLKGLYKTPKGFYSKREKFGTVFIQGRKSRLSSPGEKREIKGSRYRRNSLF